MSVKTLKRFVDSIDNAKPVNLRRLQKTIEQLSLTHRYNPTDIDASRTAKPDYYLIKSVNEDLMSELRRLVAGLDEDRISGALQNRSHDHKVDGSILLIRKSVEYPAVILFDTYGNYQHTCQHTHHPAKQALLIENRQLFIHIERTLTFLYQHCGLPKDNELDIIFGAGNEISNSLHKKLLSKYDTLYMLFDFDLGGLTIAKNLYNLSMNNSKVFLYPSDIQKRLAGVVEKFGNEELGKVITIGQDCPPLKPICEIIRNHMKFIEQESYLYAD